MVEGKKGLPPKVVIHLTPLEKPESKGKKIKASAPPAHGKSEFAKVNNPHAYVVAKSGQGHGGARAPVGKGSEIKMEVKMDPFDDVPRFSSKKVGLQQSRDETMLPVTGEVVTNYKDLTATGREALREHANKTQSGIYEVKFAYKDKGIVRYDTKVVVMNTAAITDADWSFMKNTYKISRTGD